MGRGLRLGSIAVIEAELVVIGGLRNMDAVRWQVLDTGVSKFWDLSRYSPARS